MTSSPELERKVRRLDNDVQAVYELLGRIEKAQQSQAATLDSVAGRQMRHDNRLDELAAALDTLAATQQRHGNRLDEQAATLAEHTATLAEHTATLAGHTATLAEHGATLAGHGGKLDRIIALLEARG